MLIRAAARHPHLALLIWVLLAAMAAHLVGAVARGIEFRNYVVGNPVFVVALAALVAMTGTPSRLSARYLPVIAAALALLVTMAFAALLMAENSPGPARLLAGPLTSIGAYPAGPDVWFPVGAAVWYITSFCLSVAACFAGTIIARRLQPRRRTRRTD